MTVEKLNEVKPNGIKTITLFGDTTTKEVSNYKALAKYMSREVISWRIFGEELVIFVQGEV